MSKTALPQNWMEIKIGDVAVVNERNPEVRDLPDTTDVTFLPMAAVDAFSGSIADPETRPLGSVRKGFTSFANGDVLFAKITPSMENGKAAVARSLQNGVGFGSTEFHVLRPKSGLLSEFLFYFVRQERFRQEAKRHFTGTAGQMRVPTSFLEDHPLPLPPIPEQKRITTKVDELFSELDSSIRELEVAQAELKRYRASVLAAACSGKLVPTDITKWTEVTFGHLCRVQGGYAFKSSSYIKKGVPLIRISNLINEQVQITQDTVFLPDDFVKINSGFVIHKGDVLIAMSGATTGKMATMELDVPALLNQRVGRFILQSEKLCRPEYISLLVRQASRKVLTDAYGAAQPNISPTSIEAMAVMLPPLAEQERIVAEVDRRLSVASEIEEVLSANLQRAERLRQSILQQAFSGKLVPQDVSDGSAIALLERISAERDDIQSKRKVTSKTRGRSKAKTK